MKKIAIISSHPIQYYAPWFRYLANETDLDLKVFYLWDFGITEQVDKGFKQVIKWDIPLLEGYASEFVPNHSRHPGTSHFWGLRNPTLIQRVKSFAPDAVLLMNYNYASLYHFIWQWPKRLAPLLFRGDSHRLFPSGGIKDTLRRLWISTIYRHFSGLLYVGKANANYFKHYGVSDAKLFFSPHAIDNQRFFAQAKSTQIEAAEWKAALGIPQEHRVILFAGKFSEKKRPIDLFNAFLKANLDKISLLFVGTGPLVDELRLKASSYKNIFFAPFQNQSQMPRTYAASDVFVLPSYGSGETWGLAVNEAMCLGKPIIVSDHVGCAQDLVHPGKNGLVFRAGDVESLAESLQTAFSNIGQLERWGRKSQEIIRSYSYAQTTSGLQQALLSLKLSSVASELPLDTSLREI